MKTILKILLLLTILNINYAAYASINDLDITVAPNTVNFHLEDVAGNKAGYISPGQILIQIPFIGSYIEGGETLGESTVTDALFEWHRLYTKGGQIMVPVGKYKLIVYGDTLTAPTQIKIGISIRWDDNINWHADTLMGDYIFPKVIWKYEFDVSAVPPIDNKIMLIKISDPNDLIIDINALAKEDYMGNAKFVAEIIKEINEIEAEKAKGKMDDGMTPAQKAKKEYQELLKELNEKWAKPEKDEYVDPLALDILERDITYIINHIQ